MDLPAPNTAAMAACFPGLDDPVDGHPLVYLDSAATTQKPLVVLERMDRFLREEYGTVHRGLYRRSVGSTRLYEEARDSVARFLGAAHPHEVVFTMGCTDAINLVAWSWGRTHLRPGDRVLVSEIEHHSNIVPWQLVAGITGAEVVPIPVDDAGDLDQAALDDLLDPRVKLVALIHVANALGTVNPIRVIADRVHAIGALLLVDAAQSAPHLPLDVTALDCDFLTLSAHKIYGPTGIGALYGKATILAGMPPWRGGGEMIERVSFAGTTYADPPSRFEAGTPPITEAIGFGAACEWLLAIGMERVQATEQALYTYAEDRIEAIAGLRRIGRARKRSSVISFVVPGAGAADVAELLDAQNVAIRAGHHCAQTAMARFGVPATARISLGIYTTQDDIDRAVTALGKAVDILRG